MFLAPFPPPPHFGVTSGDDTFVVTVIVLAVLYVIFLSADKFLAYRKNRQQAP